MDVFHKKNSKRGQAAIEFLMTYGWMLLIVLIVGALIFSFVDFGGLVPSAVNLGNGFVGDPTISQANSADNIILIAGQYNGRDRLTLDITDDDFNSINLSDGNDCDLVYLKNVDTNQYTNDSVANSPGDASAGFQIQGNYAGTTTISLLNSQSFIMEFQCSTGLIEGDIVEGPITLKFDNPAKGVPIRVNGDIKVDIINNG